MRFSHFSRLVAVLVLFFTVLRLEFWFWNRELFSEESWATLAWACFLGLRFDAAALAWLLMPTLIWGWVVGRAYFIPLLVSLFPFWVLTVIDMELWNFFGRRMSLSVLKMFREAEGKTGPMVLEYFPWICLGVFLGLIFFAALWWVCRGFQRGAVSRKRWWLEQVAIVIVLVVAARGGLQKKPLNPVNAHLFERAHMNQLVLNTPFTLLKSLKGSGLQRESFFRTDEQAFSHVNAAVVSEKFVPKLQGETPNVVILVLESFSWEYTGLNPRLQQEYTPFLNSLMKKSLTFTKGFANGRRSIEGVAALLTGIPALMEEPFVTSEFATNDFEGLGEVFARRGYLTSFYHGGDNGTMHFDSFTAKAGFQSYFGSREYPNPDDHDGVWGIWDRPYFQYFAQELSGQKEPFLSVLFTLSSHQPYRVPEFEKDRFPEQPEHLILKSISYADSALRGFFKTAEKQPWYSNTLFILVADHTGPIIFHRQDHPLVEYRVPLLFFHPGIKNWPSEIDRTQIAQQIDLPASLYDLLGFEGEKVPSLSRSVFRSGPKTYTAFAAGVYWHTDGEVILIEQGRQKNFVKFDSPLLPFPSQVPQAEKLSEQLKAVRQVYSSDLWNQRK
ncbi:MAG: LTA synthase family protein [Bdellovibrionales bacterium]